MHIFIILGILLGSIPVKGSPADSNYADYLTHVANQETQQSTQQSAESAAPSQSNYQDYLTYQQNEEEKKKAQQNQAEQAPPTTPIAPAAETLPPFNPEAGPLYPDLSAAKKPEPQPATPEAKKKEPEKKPAEPDDPDALEQLLNNKEVQKFLTDIGIILVKENIKRHPLLALGIWMGGIAGAWVYYDYLFKTRKSGFLYTGAVLIAPIILSTAYEACKSIYKWAFPTTTKPGTQKAPEPKVVLVPVPVVIR